MSLVLKNILEFSQIKNTKYLLFIFACFGFVFNFIASLTNLHIKTNQYLKKSLSYLASANLIIISTIIVIFMNRSNINYKTLRLAELIFTQPIYFQSYINLLKYKNNEIKVKPRIIIFILMSFFAIFYLAFLKYFNLGSISNLHYTILSSILSFGILITFIKNFILKFNIKEFLYLLIIFIPTLFFILAYTLKKKSIYFLKYY